MTSRSGTPRTAEIRLTVDLDADNVATRIQWQAAEAPGGGPATCQSMMLALWDSGKKTTAAIDLWTRDMTVEDMNVFFYQVLHKMADTYLRATKNESAAQTIREFGNRFGDGLGLR
jgi:gliding motility-associated protein GldC